MTVRPPPRRAATAVPSGVLAPFRQRSFRYQWPADLLTSWAFEMETLILGWYLLVETGSVVWLTAFGALVFLGTINAPLFGVMGDRTGHRAVLCAMRGAYALLAAVIAGMALTGTLGPVQVLAAAVLAGLVRPADMGMRNALIAASMPPPLLMAAVGIGRTTADSARIMGALAGAGLAAALGMANAYLVIVGLYLAAMLLTLGTAPRPAGSAAPLTTPWRDLRDGFAQVRDTPCLMAAVSLAFLVNFCAFPLTGGLLPYVAKEVYAVDRTGLGFLSASFAAGGLAGSFLVGVLGARVRPGRAMLVACLVWYALLVVFARTDTALAGILVLALAGFAQSLGMAPLAVMMLNAAGPDYRGRVMGARMLAVYGLPVGLFLAGPLIEALGWTATATLYAVFGIAATLAIALRWRRALWPRDAMANAGRGA